MRVIYTSKGLMKCWGARYLSKNTVFANAKLLHFDDFSFSEKACVTEN
jgi:hypothetical protein